MHVGPYAKENQTIARRMAFAERQGLSFHGLHHEIYLSDPRRVPRNGSGPSCVTRSDEKAPAGYQRVWLRLKSERSMLGS